MKTAKELQSIRNRSFPAYVAELKKTESYDGRSKKKSLLALAPDLEDFAKKNKHVCSTCLAGVVRHFPLEDLFRCDECGKELSWEEYNAS